MYSALIWTVVAGVAVLCTVHAAGPTTCRVKAGTVHTLEKGKLVAKDQTECDKIREAISTPAMRNPFMPEEGNIEDMTVVEVGGNLGFVWDMFSSPSPPSRNDESKTANCWRASAITVCLEKFNAECATPAEKSKPKIPYLASRTATRKAIDCA